MAGKAGPREVRDQIAGGRVPPVWLWAGPEDLLKEECFEALVAKLVESSLAEFLVHRFRGTEDSIEEAIAACRQIPMLGGRQIVEIRDVDGLRVREMEALCGYLKSPAPETALILAPAGGDRDPKVREIAAFKVPVAVFWPPFENQMPAWVADRFRRLGKRCDDMTAKGFLDAVRGGADAQLSLREMLREIEKVALRAGERPAVTEGDLEVLARHSNERLLYMVADKTLTRDNAGALLALEGALRFKENNEVLAVAVLTRRILGVAALRQGMDAGLSAEEAFSEAGIWDRERPLFAGVLPRWREPHIRQALRALASADRLLKSSPKDPRIVLEGAIAVLCREDA
jgi:DNA polymerase-3 subunit delta